MKSKFQDDVSPKPEKAHCISAVGPVENESEEEGVVVETVNEESEEEGIVVDFAVEEKSEEEGVVVDTVDKEEEEEEQEEQHHSDTLHSKESSLVRGYY